MFRESFEASERVSRVNWFSSGLQSVSRVNWFSSGLQARFASQLVQFGASSAFRESIGSVRGFKRVSRVNWFSSGLQSAFRESIGSVRGFRAYFASQLGASERVS